MSWDLRTKWSLFLLLAGTALLCLSTAVYAAQHAHEHAAAATSAPAEPEDPFKASSELNHHLAGYGLIAVGLLVLAGLAFPRVPWLKLVWPAIFVAAGLFLVVWSDPEIWPRGEHGWLWMLQHGPGSRQHKMFALLMIALGAVEYLRARDRLGRFWQMWAFPMLAVFGAGLLLFHPHKVTASPPPPAPAAQHQHAATEPAPAAQHQHAATEPAPAAQHQHAATEPAPAAQHQHATPAPAPQHGEHAAGQAHVMTPTMVRVQREHLWFAVVGAAVALFKFLSDARFWKVGFLPYLWPGAITVLGVLLVLYRE